MVHWKLTRALLGIGIATVLLSAVILNGTHHDLGSSLLSTTAQRPIPKEQFQELYDIPNFVYQRTQMHFPQAEESWLNMAAQGKIGDDVKPEPILKKLNDIISDARTHALTENYEARVKAKKLAIEDNYSTYDVQKGKVVHKIYGKQVGGSMTLKQNPSSPASLQAKTVQLSQLPSKEQDSAPKDVPYAVQVPKGLRSGQQFIAEVPAFGRMLVTVPQGAVAGQLVAIQVPMPAAAADAHAAAAAVSPTHLGSEHPNAANMLDSALAAHAREARAISAVTAAHSAGRVRRARVAMPRGSEHPNAAGMLSAALEDHYAAPAAASGPHVVSDGGAVDPAYARSGSEHPVAAGMLDAALRGHRDDAPHSVFGMEH